MRSLRRVLTCLGFFLVFMFTVSAPTVKAEFPERPVAFVVIDHDGDVNGSIYKSWRAVVKWAYHFPYYKITDNGSAQSYLSESIAVSEKIDKEILAAIAEKSKVDVLVVARIYEMDEQMITGFGFYNNHETYMRVEADADLFVYKQDGNKFLKKRLRKRNLKEIGNYEHPEETIKWELSKLVNTMENRPIIGA